MSDKTLQDKAIDFKGKKYVLVSDRVLYFNETYPKGGIRTELISPHDADTVIIKATVYPEGTDLNPRFFTGYSQATWGEGYINKTSALENAETSAVGRALAFMGIGVIESIASVDEINKAQTYPHKAPQASISPQDTRKQVEMDIEEANDIDSLNTVYAKIKSAKKLTDKDKQELSDIITKKIMGFDPTE